MPKKENLPDRGIVRVTFDLPAEVQGNVIHLVGDFTGWEGTPMEKQPDGSWRTTVDLAPGSTYEFRYLIDGTRWENDWHADGYVSNAFGQENSVVTTPDLTAAGGAQGSATKQTSRQKRDSTAAAKKTAQAPAKKGTKTPAKKVAAKKTAKAPAKKTVAKKTTAVTSPAKQTTATKSDQKAGSKKSTMASPATKTAATKGEAAQQTGADAPTSRASAAGGHARDERGRMAAGPRPTATDGAPDA